MSKVNVILVIALGFMGLASLMVSGGVFGLAEAWLWLSGRGISPEAILVLEQIRLPRLILAIMVGFALGISGAALQGLLRNPLAEPGTLGIAAMAGLFAVLCFYSGYAARFGFALPLSAISGGLLAMILIKLMIRRRYQGHAVILAGVAVASTASALTLLAINFAPNPWAIGEILQWLMGSLKDRGWQDLFYSLPAMVIGVGFLLASRRGLEALSLGELTAISLGFSPQYLLRLIIPGAALATGAAVAAAGSVGFVGLMAGHYARAINRQHPGHSLLPAGLIGAILTVMADALARALPSSQEINLGVVTALIGAPFLIILTRRIGYGR